MTDAREAALEELYASAPEAFTAKRDALARRLAKEGDAGAAAEVKARRKPTQIAYVLNQLARRHPEDLAELVDIGRELSRAQRGALRGGRGPDLREAIGRQRSAINRLTAKTGSLMRGLGMTPEGHLEEIASALQAALVDPAVGAALEEGRLEKAPGPAVGFPEIVQTAAPRRHEAAAKAQAKHDAKREKATERARRESDACEERAAEADHAAEAAESEARAREDAASALAKRSGELAAEARRLAAEQHRVLLESKELAKAATAAERAAKQARAAATEATAEAARARRAAERAAKKLES